MREHNDRTSPEHGIPAPPDPRPAACAFRTVSSAGGPRSGGRPRPPPNRSGCPGPADPARACDGDAVGNRPVLESIFVRSRPMARSRISRTARISLSTPFGSGAESPDRSRTSRKPGHAQLPPAQARRHARNPAPRHPGRAASEASRGPPPYPQPPPPPAPDAGFEGARLRRPAAPRGLPSPAPACARKNAWSAACPEHQDPTPYRAPPRAKRPPGDFLGNLLGFPNVVQRLRTQTLPAFVQVPAQALQGADRKAHPPDLGRKPGRFTRRTLGHPQPRDVGGWPGPPLLDPTQAFIDRHRGGSGRTAGAGPSIRDHAHGGPDRLRGLRHPNPGLLTPYDPGDDLVLVLDHGAQDRATQLVCRFPHPPFARFEALRRPRHIQLFPTVRQDPEHGFRHRKRPAGHVDGPRGGR